MSPNKRRPMRSLFVLLLTTLVACGTLVYGHIKHDASYTPSLALDLEGGTQLILTPVSSSTNREITEQDISEAINVIRQRVDASGVAEAEITSLGTSNIVVALPGNPSKETLDLIRTSSQMIFRSVLQAGYAINPEAGSAQGPQSGQGAQDSAQSGDAAQSASASDTPPASAEASQSAVSEASQASTGHEMQSGADQSAQSEASAAEQDEQGPLTAPSTAIGADEAMSFADANKDGKLSDAPETTPADNSDPAWITEQVIFDFLTTDCSTAESRSQAALSDPEKAAVACDEQGIIKYILGPVDVSGALLSSASAGPSRNSQGQPTGQWSVGLQFDTEGTKLFAEASERLYRLQNDSQAQPGAIAGRDQFAVVLDGRVITAPRMNQVISTGTAEITGNFTVESASQLAKQLNFGSLPLNFEVQSEQQISATLGADHLQKGIWAGLVGLVLVVVYMLWQYRGLGILAASSLFVAGGLTYLVITLLSWAIGYRLSLSGVAGLIVSVGVTADSFIVYFERIRDEVRDGHPLRSAVSEGWDRAKRTIIVSDAVNLVAAVVLYVLAVGGVQGFAFTLGVTTIVDLIVIFWFTHPMMELLMKVPFFGNGHKLSGLDPVDLGAKSGLVYAGRGRVVHREAQDGASGMSIAERRRLERRKEEQAMASQEEGDN